MSQFASMVGKTCDWRIVALARSFLAFALAFLLARLSGARLIFRGPAVLWLRSCAGSFSLLCTFFAFSYLTSAEVLTLTNTFPIWVAILSWPLLRVRPGPSVWLAACCGVVGVVVMQQENIALSAGLRLAAVPLALLAALSSAVAMLGLHRLKGEMDTWAIVVHFSGVATLFVLGAIVVGGLPDLETITASSVGLLLAVGGTATVGQLCLTRAFTLGEPSRVSVVRLAQVVFALGLDVLFTGPAFEVATLAGIGLVMAPTAWMMASKAGE